MAKAPFHATLATRTDRTDYAKYSKLDRGALLAQAASRSLSAATLGFSKEDLIAALMTADG